MTYDPTSYTQTQEIGFFERVGASLIGIPLGILLIFFPISILWWNEGRNVEAQQAIEQALARVVTVPPAPLSPANEGKLVHVIGTATASGVTDSAMGAGLPGLLLVERRVEMYQWRERKSQQTKDNWGGSQTVTTQVNYDKVWSSTGLDSRFFRVPQGHANPPMLLTPAMIPAEDARLGAFRLGPNTLGALTRTSLMRGGDGSSVAFEVGDGFGSLPDGFVPVRPERTPPGYRFDANGGLYRGDNPKTPAIGDIRVSYVGVPAGRLLTVVGKQSGEGFTDYPVARGYTIQLAAVGERSAESLLDDQAAREATLTWLMRLGGVLLMWIGFMLLLGPLAALVSVVPVFATLAEGLTAVTAFFLALMLGMITIAAAWLLVHPVFSIITILLALLIGGGALYLRRA
ncbi:MAG: TMEM43 family protein [Rhodospirillaceae bacterium]